jgi:hypothetical protein
LAWLQEFQGRETSLIFNWTKYQHTTNFSKLDILRNQFAKVLWGRQLAPKLHKGIPRKWRGAGNLCVGSHGNFEQPLLDLQLQSRQQLKGSETISPLNQGLPSVDLPGCIVKGFEHREMLLKSLFHIFMHPKLRVNDAKRIKKIMLRKSGVHHVWESLSYVWNPNRVALEDR